LNFALELTFHSANLFFEVLIQGNLRGFCRTECVSEAANEKSQGSRKLHGEEALHQSGKFHPKPGI
jgi:hypothetical protein